MIKTQLVKQDNKPVAVIVDYKEYLRLKELLQNGIKPTILSFPRRDYVAIACIDCTKE
jgi:hypothetical protein